MNNPANTSKTNYLTQQVLKRLGNDKPTISQLLLTESLLFEIMVRISPEFLPQLTDREIGCLVLAAKGKTIAQAAYILDVKCATIETWRKSIKKKLNCSSFTQAVFKAFHFGYLSSIQMENKKSYLFSKDNFSKLQRNNKG